MTAKEEKIKVFESIREQFEKILKEHDVAAAITLFDVVDMENGDYISNSFSPIDTSRCILKVGDNAFTLSPEDITEDTKEEDIAYTAMMLKALVEHAAVQGTKLHKASVIFNEAFGIDEDDMISKARKC